MAARSICSMQVELAGGGFMASKGVILQQVADAPVEDLLQRSVIAIDRCDAGGDPVVALNLAPVDRVAMGNEEVFEEQTQRAAVAFAEGVDEVQFAEAFGYMADRLRSEEHTSELQSLMRISYAGFC